MVQNGYCGIWTLFKEYLGKKQRLYNNKVRRMPHLQTEGSSNKVLRPHPASQLEYWFFKFNDHDVALLVDWIARRRTSAGEVRISIHSPTAREVIFLDHAPILENGPPELNMQATSWYEGDVRWELALEISDERIRPQIFPAEQLEMFDMSLVSAPRVSFTGWIEHRGNRYPVNQALGMLSHYWGRQLPKEWWWISANQFSDADVSIECTLLRSRIWGSTIGVPLGYFYYRNGSRSSLLISPPARIAVAGSQDAFQLVVRSLLGRKIILEAKGREYASLGDGIVNTLIGDLQIKEGGKTVAHAEATAGLERRTPHFDLNA
jgi:hypothetical protein